MHFSVTAHRTEHSQQAPLSLAASAQQRGKRFALPAEVRLVGLLPDPDRVIHKGEHL